MFSLEVISNFVSSVLLPLALIPRILVGLADFFGFIILLVIGAVIIVLIVGLAIVFLPAILLALIVFFLTGSFFYAGIAFLIVALISLVSLATK